MSGTRRLRHQRKSRTLGARGAAPEGKTPGPWVGFAPGMNAAEHSSRASRCLGAEIVEGVLDGAVEGGIGVDHLAQTGGWHFGVDGDGKGSQDFPTGGSDGGGTHEHTTVGVFDELDQALVAGLVDPPPR